MYKIGVYSNLCSVVNRLPLSNEQKRSFNSMLQEDRVYNNLSDALSTFGWCMHCVEDAKRFKLEVCRALLCNNQFPLKLKTCFSLGNLFGTYREHIFKCNLMNVSEEGRVNIEILDPENNINIILKDFDVSNSPEYFLYRYILENDLSMISVDMIIVLYQNFTILPQTIIKLINILESNILKSGFTRTADDFPHLVFNDIIVLAVACKFIQNGKSDNAQQILCNYNKVHNHPVYAISFIDQIIAHAKSIAINPHIRLRDKYLLLK